MAWWERAKVGDKVVCVEAAKAEHIEPGVEARGPLVGEVYEIAEITLSDRCIWKGCSVYFDVGLGNYAHASLFAPAKSTETGMTILRGLLSRKPVSVAQRESEVA